jgi:hypothetical protein
MSGECDVCGTTGCVEDNHLPPLERAVRTLVAGRHVQGDPMAQRIRTLEDALRPFAEEAKSTQHWPTRTGPELCMRCRTRRPCKYETARRALEGE